MEDQSTGNLATYNDCQIYIDVDTPSSLFTLDVSSRKAKAAYYYSQQSSKHRLCDL